MIDPDTREILAQRAAKVDNKPPLFGPDDDSRVRQPLRALSAMYRQASGVAFAGGHDDAATKFRDAAKLLDDVACSLPALPTATR